MEEFLREWQPLFAAIAATISLATLGLVLKLAIAFRSAARDQISVVESRLAAARDDLERTEKWNTRERQLLEREVDRTSKKLTNLLDSSGVTLEALALGDALGAEVKGQIAPLVEELQEKLAMVSAGMDGLPRNPDVELTLARGTMALGKSEEAADLFDDYTPHAPSDWEVQLSRAVAHANARRGKGSDLQALRAYNESIALLPESESGDTKARLFSYRGAIFKRLGRLDEAEADLRLALRYATETYEQEDAWYNLAGVYALRGDRDSMLDAVERLRSNSMAIAGIRAHLHDYFSDFAEDEALLRYLKS